MQTGDLSLFLIFEVNVNNFEFGNRIGVGGITISPVGDLPGLFWQNYLLDAVLGLGCAESDLWK